MPVQFANNATTRLAADLTAAAISFVAIPGDGAKFPALAAGDWFPVTLIKTGGGIEIVRCTARAGDVFTIERGQEGTAAMAFLTGERAELRATAAALADHADAVMLLQQQVATLQDQVAQLQAE